MKTWTLVLALALAWATEAAAAPQAVSGHFKADRKGEIRPTSVAAFPTRPQGDPLKKVIAVVLSEGTMDVPAALQSLDPRTALINQEGMQHENYITFVVHPDGLVGMNATFSEGMVQYLDSTRGMGAGMTAKALVAELTANGPDRVAGRIHTAQPVKTMDGESYELDVTFDTAITRPPGGKDLGGTGGEPGQALTRLLAAIQEKDWPGVQAGVRPSQLESRVSPDASDQENLAEVVESISLFLPKGKARVIGGEQMGEVAVLELEGEMAAGDPESKALYLVRMVQEGSAWRFDRARLAGFL